MLVESLYTGSIMSTSALPSFPTLPPVAAPDPSALLQTLSGAMEARVLRWIAEADHGFDAGENEQQLRRIAWSGELPPLMAWRPREVLELTRWDQPSPDNGDAAFRRRHKLRAFACVAPLRSYGDPRNHSEYQSGREATALHLLGSVAVLAPALTHLDRDAAALLTWVLPPLAAQDPEDHAFIGLAAFWFALGAAWPDRALLALAQWVTESEDTVSGQWRKPLGVGAAGPWLLPLTKPARREAWRRVGVSLPGRLPAQCGAAVRETVELLAVMIND